jgi:uncharacterized protein YndB with AHSA1/START domain
MSTVAVTRVIDAPVTQVWRVFTNLAGRCDWLSTVTGVEILTEGAFGEGTIWRESRSMPDGSEVTEEFRVNDCVDNERFVVVSPGIGADYQMTYTFQQVETGRHQGGTSVTVVQEGAPTSPAGRILVIVFGGLAARTVEGALRRDLDDLAHTSVTGTAAA